MIGIILNNEIKLFGSIPKTWNNILNYHLADAQVHYDDGFRDVVQPTYNTETQRKGGIYFDEVNDYFTYEVIDKTIEEIQAEILANSEAQKEVLIQEKLKVQVENEVQALPDTEALNNQGLYPTWTHPFYYTLDFKCQHFNAENELVLYKCVQAHESQENWQPKDVPALFVRIAQEGEILDWVQPQGSHDAYQTGDKVNHNGQVWISVVDDNIWEPSVYGWEIYTG
ncbi:MAG: hypothetical protein ABIL39_11640 [candidate division WOR-3 bacterium]